MKLHLLYFWRYAIVRISNYTSKPLQTSFRFSYNFALLKQSSPCLQSTCLLISVGLNYHFRLLESDWVWPPMMLIFLSSADLNHIFIYEFLRIFLCQNILCFYESIFIIIKINVPKCSLRCSACNTFTSWNCWGDTFGWNHK